MNARSLSSRRLRYLTFAGLGVTSVTACAADPFTISDIRIEGLQRIEPGSVFAYLPMKQGDTYNDDLASEAIRKLYATGFFNDVKVATEGTVVIVQVQERPAISSIDF
ncbi:POTRA domain-containing protein, partial [Burkholderia gladioli]